jgi:hypothetical protein
LLVEDRPSRFLVGAAALDRVHQADVLLSVIQLAVIGHSIEQRSSLKRATTAQPADPKPVPSGRSS